LLGTVTCYQNGRETEEKGRVQKSKTMGKVEEIRKENKTQGKK
jgi:hypothetical protein